MNEKQISSQTAELANKIGYKGNSPSQSAMKAWLRIECDTHVDAHKDDASKQYMPNIKIGNFLPSEKGKPRHTYTNVIIAEGFNEYENALEFGFQEALRHLISRRSTVLKGKN
jgi:hypothetical protein